MEQQREADIWERWEWFWPAVFYATTTLSAGLVLLDDEAKALLWIVVLLTTIMLLWHGSGMRWAYQDLISWEEDPLPRFAIIIGDIVLWFILVNLSPVYYLALFGVFSQVFRHLPVRYATGAAVLLTIAIIYEQVTDTGESFSLTSPTFWLFLFIGVAGILFGLWVSAIIRQSAQRRELIEQLKATQADLAETKRREGILTERQRLAQEIHDTLAQGFTSIVMHLEAAEQALPDETAILQKHLNQARSTARTSLEQARRVVQDLRPDLLEKQSLVNAIQRTVRGWQEETGIPIATQTTGTPSSLPLNIEVALLRATQEALNNIRKHAQASDVQVTLSYMSDVVILDIQDNGLGLDGAQPSQLSGGYGLQAMRERVEQCGGSISLESELEEGTTVVITIPI